MSASGTDPRAATTVDPMLATVERSPEQWRRALALAHAAHGPGPTPRAVVVAGMGGSGVAGDVAGTVGAEHGRVPVVPVHGERLPAFVGPDDLVVLVSHSGTTGETLLAARAALDSGARVAAVTAGGALGELVAEAGGRVVEVPAEGPPRAAVAFLTVPVLGVLEDLGVVTGVLERCARVPEELTALLAAWGRTDGSAPSAPAALARALGHRAPVFLGADAVAEVVATRARNQVAENAERPAVAAALPEAAHNQLVGWAGAGTGGVCDLVVLRSSDESAVAARRVAALVELAGAGFAAVHEHRLPAGDPILRLAGGFLFADLLSVHLALEAGVDPTPIAAIEELKRRL